MNNTTTAKLSDGSDLQLSQIEENRYAISVTIQSGEIFYSNCEFTREKLSEEKSINVITYESDDFQKAIMHGKIQSKEIANAIKRLHET